jgi:hypothetical protein
MNKDIEQPRIPEEVARFVLIHIPSIPYLEAMLLLRRESGQTWTAQQLAQRLYQSERAAQEVLSELCTNGVTECVEDDALRYRYQPNSEDLAGMIEQLEGAYAAHLIDITNLVHSKSSKRAKQFADAFLWRKGK